MRRNDCWEIVSFFDKEQDNNKLTSLKIPSFNILDAIQA
jgi:hypothetical protein